MHELLSGLLWVAIGSALGGVARFAVSRLVGRRVGEAFPWGTLAVNVTGAFAIGVVAALVADEARAAGPWLFGVVGFLGSYTTVSAFSLQTLALARDGQLGHAGWNVLLSVVLCLSAVTVGYLLGRGIP